MSFPLWGFPPVLIWVFYTAQCTLFTALEVFLTTRQVFLWLPTLLIPDALMSDPKGLAVPHAPRWFQGSTII